jgi:hypothetical protein
MSPTRHSVIHEPKRTKKQTGIEAVSSMQSNSDDEDMHGTEEPNAECHVLVGATIGDANDDIIYTDLTGKFPIKLFHGNQLVFVAMCMARMPY